MRQSFLFLTLALGSLCALPAMATGLATCDSGERSTWQPVATLEAKLKAEGWTVRRTKEDGGCYEVYALDEKGERVEAYFHPVTFERIPVEDHD